MTQSRQQPPRAAKPRSTMVAVSTPGWKVSEHGLIIPDPSYVTDTEMDAEGSPCSEYLYEGPELKVEEEDRPWTRKQPPLPGVHLLHLLGFVRTEWRRPEATDEALDHFWDIGSPMDLINEHLMDWLFSIMQGSKWSSIDVSSVSRGCSSELEDKIENLLRKVQAEQGPMDFNISNADDEVQKTLAALVKRLCLRQGKVNETLKYWNSMQKVLGSGPKDDSGRAVYDHPTNNYEDREARSVSPERPALPSIGEKPGPVRRDPLGTKTNPIDLTV